MLASLIPWVQAHLALVVDVLGLIVVLDNALAAMSSLKSNSSVQLVLAGINQVVAFVQSLLPKSGS